MKIKLNSKGAKTLVIDCGVLGEPSFQPNITREEVAEAALGKPAGGRDHYQTEGQKV